MCWKAPNAHYDHESLLPSAANTAGTYGPGDLVTTADFSGTNAGRLPDQALIFTMGCHAGLSADDVQLGFAALDWAQLYAGGGDQFLGHTTYGYGDTEIVAFSERLSSLFAANVAKLLAGSAGAPATLGDAIRMAKRSYLAGTLVLTPYDEKVTQSLTYYGLPMYSIAGANRIATPAAAPTSATTTSPVVFGSTTTDPRTGLGTRSVNISLTPTIADSGPANLNRVSTPSGTYYEVGGNTVTAPHHPIEPLVDAPIPGAAASGLLITGLTSFEELPFAPVYLQTNVDNGAGEPAIVPADGSFPSRLQRITTDADGSQRLLVAAGQFQADAAMPGSGRQRNYSSIRGQLYTAGPGSDGFGPRFASVEGNAGVNNNNVVFFQIETSDPAKRVVVVYRIVGTNTWRSIDLANAHGNVWLGGVPVTAGQIVEFFGEAVDAAGDVSITNNKVTNFFSAPAAVDGHLTIAVTNGTASDGYYRTPVGITISNISGTAQYSIDGGPFTTYNGTFTVSGDGGHVVFAQDGSGAQLLYVVIDASAPILSAQRFPDAEWTAGSSTVFLDATDVGQSGVRSITYSLSGATTAGPTTTLGNELSISITAPGQTTVTAYATDIAGNQSAPISITVKIDVTNPVMGTPTVSPAPTNGWNRGPTTVGFTATDTGSGVASITYSASGAASIAPTTVPASAASATVSAEGVTTVTAFATDVAGNRSTNAGATVRIDSIAPAATITLVQSDGDGDGLLEATGAKYACADGTVGSGVQLCELRLDGTVVGSTTTGALTTYTFGSLSFGTHTLSVRATDVAGNQAAVATTTTFVAGYRVCLLYDPTQAKSIGATYVVKLQLCDAAGHNLSSRNITLTALTIDGLLNPGTNDAGNANNGYLFRFSANDSSYIYNLKTNGLPPGTHRLYFTTQPVPDRSGLPTSPPPTNAALITLKV